MKPSEVKAALRLYMLADVPIYLGGSPGIGKSSLVHQIVEEDKLELIELRGPQLDAVDVRGLPAIRDEVETYWTRPSFMPTKGKGIMFIDELSSAPALVQAALYELILDRRIGEYKLPKGWRVIAAGNLETDRAVVVRMSTALSNRFGHIIVEPDLNDFVAYGLENEFCTEMIAGLRFRPELLFQFDPKRNDKAFATPRTWEMVSKIIKAHGSLDVPLEILAGLVGEGPAAEMRGFFDIYRSLVDPDVVLMSPDKAEVPEEPSALFAICAALASKASDTTIPNIVKYANRLPEEFSVLLIKDCHARDDSIANTRAFIEWLSKHADVLT